MKRITIRDIAKMLSISPSTVSRALSDHPDISKATKDRVNEVANAFNYTVNLHANFFRNRKSNLIALIIPEINMFYTPSLIKRLKKELAKTGYSLFILLSEDSYKTEKEMVKQCLKWSVEGVLISLSGKTKNLTHLKQLYDSGIKTVLIDKVISNKKYHWLVSDSFGSGYSAVSHLIANGHQHILGIFGNPRLSITQHRITGFKQALSDHGLSTNTAEIIAVEEKDELKTALIKELTGNSQITAIFTMSDEILAYSHHVLGSLGLEIGEDISLITISDGKYPYMLYPNITFVKDSGSKMACKGLQILLDLIEGRVPKKKTVLKTKLIALDSVKNLNEKDVE